jgi:hypothetical protein
VSIHPAYRNDSILTEPLVYDLIETMNQISQGKLEVPQLLGQLCNVHHSKLPPTTPGMPSTAPPWLSVSSASSSTPLLSSAISTSTSTTTTPSGSSEGAARPLSTASTSSNDQLTNGTLNGTSHGSPSGSSGISDFKVPLPTPHHEHEQGPYLEGAGAAHSLHLSTRVR